MNGPRVVLLTADGLRHRWAARYLAGRVPLAGVVREAKHTPVPEALRPEPGDAEVLATHFAERDAAEHRLLGDGPLPDAPVFDVPPGGVNAPAVEAWVRGRAPDLVVCYGTSIVRPPLLDALDGRLVNVHLGLSPYYRGSGTNFWPLVNAEPECVGATIHMAVARVDAGPILAQLRPEASPGDGAHDLGCKTIGAAFAALPEVLAALVAGRLRPRPQRLEIGRVYRRADFCADAVRRMRANLDAGMLGRYLKDPAPRRAAVPIVELAA